jgi:16S rRNA (guanine527-N7)-methyltransferase
MDFNLELKKLEIELSPEQLNKFDIYYNDLIEVNKYMNLTAITEHDEVYIKHFYDSLTIKLAINNNDEFSLCDVGSGAGFPSIPYSIYNNKCNVTIIDSLNKRINFLNDLVKKLELNNVKAIHSRAEDFAVSNRESFDYVTARALARLNVLVELTLPLVKVGGKLIAMKGDSKEELDEAQNAIKTLGGKVIDIIELDLPNNLGHRSIVVIEKISKTPNKYPRLFAKIKERPL